MVKKESSSNSFILVMSVIIILLVLVYIVIWSIKKVFNEKESFRGGGGGFGGHAGSFGGMGGSFGNSGAIAHGTSPGLSGAGYNLSSAQAPYVRNNMNIDRNPQISNRGMWEHRDGHDGIRNNWHHRLPYGGYYFYNQFYNPYYYDDGSLLDNTPYIVSPTYIINNQNS